MSAVERPSSITCITKPIPGDIFRRCAVWITRLQHMASESSQVLCNDGVSMSVGPRL